MDGWRKVLWLGLLLSACLHGNSSSEGRSIPINSAPAPQNGETFLGHIPAAWNVTGSGHQHHENVLRVVAISDWIEEPDSQLFVGINTPPHTPTTRPTPRPKPNKFYDKHVIKEEDYKFLTDPKNSERDKQIYMQQLIKRKGLSDTNKDFNNDITFVVIEHMRPKQGHPDREHGYGFDMFGGAGLWTDPKVKKQQGGNLEKEVDDTFRVSKEKAPMLQFKQMGSTSVFSLRDLGKKYIVTNANEDRAGHRDEYHFAGAMDQVSNKGVHKNDFQRQNEKIMKEAEEAKSIMTFDRDTEYTPHKDSCALIKNLTKKNKNNSSRAKKMSQKAKSKKKNC